MPESFVIKPVQVRFSDYLGQHWSLTFRADINHPGAEPHRGVAPKSNNSAVRWGRAATAHQAAEPRGSRAVPVRFPECYARLRYRTPSACGIL
jgi:hypothetical protein